MQVTIEINDGLVELLKSEGVISIEKWCKTILEIYYRVMVEHSF